jgi:integrase/recombinase XerD
MTKLREQYKRDLEIKAFSRKTQQTYLRQMIAFSRYYGKSPDLLGQEEIKDFLHYLISERKLSKSYVNQTYSALKFFYETTLGREWEMKSIPRAKRDKKLPQVFSKDEVKRILECTINLKHKAILATIYASGLRVGEAVNLKLTDIDSSNMQIRVRLGKGNKERLTVLAKSNLDILRDYFRRYRPEYWLFPGSDERKPITTRTVENVLEASKAKAGITKPGSTHLLRHSFATHLLESGVDVHYIQSFLGHSSPKTTSIYLHVTSSKVKTIKSPLDTMDGGLNE